MSSEKIYDELLYPILCSEENIFGFFDRIFEFLYRRTDFFKLKGVDSPELGLAKGEAEKIVKSIFCKYMQQAVLEQKSQSICEIENVPLDYIAEETVVTDYIAEETVVPDYIAEETVVTDYIAEETVVPDYIAEETVVTDYIAEETVVPDYIAEETVVTDYIAEETVLTTESDHEENVVKPLKDAHTTIMTDVHISEKKQVDNQSETKVPAMDSDSYNGACYEDYSWSQSIRDTDIRVKVPSDVSSGKQVRVNIQQTHLKIELHKEDKWTVLKEGDFSWLVNVEESTWTLVPHEHIHVCLQKLQERWWDYFFVGEPKIDLKAIDPSIAYEELDTDSQSKIQELMYNEHMKRLGKPSIQQSKIQNILKEAWNQDGSPFKGQPFDPSIVNIQNS